jgi:hypothetical protein
MGAKRMVENSGPQIKTTHAHTKILKCNFLEASSQEKK